MTAIVLNLMTGAVSEYDGFEFDSLTASRAASVDGLFLLGGDTDAGEPIVSTIKTSMQQWGSSHKKTPQTVYVAVEGEGTGEITVCTPGTEYAYEFPVSASGQSRCKPGLGIREAYLGFGYSNPGGHHFQLDCIEVDVAVSKNRRV